MVHRLMDKVLEFKICEQKNFEDIENLISAE
jgi:hypothetical protein